MTSNKLNEILNKTRRLPYIALTPEQVEELVKDLELLEKYKRVMCEPIKDIMKDLEELDRYRNEKYKHWNIFFNGAKLEYLLYLEQKGKESFMESISEELFTKIKNHFLE